MPPPTIWSAEKVVTAIQERALAGELINSGSVQKERQPLYAAALKYHGNWKNAVTAAGFTYDSVCKPRGHRSRKEEVQAEPQEPEDAAEEQETYDDAEWEMRYEKDLLSIYLLSIGRYRPVTKKELKELWEGVCRGNLDARNTLVVRNLRLPLKYAFGLGKHPDNKSLDVLDLIQEGNIGLLEGATRYEYERGLEFSTYAVWWVKQTMYRAIADTGRLVRLPVHRLDMWWKIKTASSSFERATGQRATKEDIAQALGVSEKEIEDAYIAQSASEVSLDAPLHRRGGGASHEGETFSLKEVIRDTKTQSPLDALIAREEAEGYLEGFGALLVDCPEREQRIFRLRYGLNSSLTPKTLEEVAYHEGVTRERIRQIIDCVWEKLERVDEKLEEIFHPLSELRFAVHRRIHGAKRHIRKKVEVRKRQCLTCGSILSAYNRRDRCFRHPDAPREKRAKKQELSTHQSVPDFRVTLAAVQQVAPASTNGSPDAQEILRTVAEAYDVDLEEFLSARRTAKVAWARHVAMYLLREDLGWPLTKIAEYFGRDHTTVLHGCNKIKEVSEANVILWNAIAKIRARLRRNPSLHL